jgi:hypothetical protein
MQKSNIRNIYKEKRPWLSLAQKAKLDDMILIRFQKLLMNIPVLIVTYPPIKNFVEFDPQYITEYCYIKSTGNKLVYFKMINHNAFWKCI